MSFVGEENWTYSGDPTDSDRDAVRFEVGDTDENDRLLSDGEVTYCLNGRAGDLSRGTDWEGRIGRGL